MRLTGIVALLAWQAVMLSGGMTPSSAAASPSVVTNNGCSAAAPAQNLQVNQFTTNTAIDFLTGGFCVVIAGGDFGLRAVPTSACSTLPVSYLAGQFLVDPLGNLCVGGSFTVNTITGYATSANQTTEITALQTLAGTVGSTPVALTTSTVTTPNTANNLFAASGTRKGCWVKNPTSAAGTLYLNAATTATAALSGSNADLAPGGVWYCPPGMSTALSAISVAGGAVQGEMW